MLKFISDINRNNLQIGVYFLGDSSWRVLPMLMMCLFFLLDQKMAMAEDPKNNQVRYENLSLLNKVMFFVEKNYVEEVKEKELFYGAIKGMLEALDPHSSFLTPELYRDMKDDTAGKFGGIGIEVGMKNNILTVISPIDDTPGFRAGIKAGDRIVKINRVSTKGYSMAEAISKLRGSKGTEITLGIWRKGFERPKDFRITRAEIKAQSVKSEALNDGYLYLRLTNFNETAAADLKRAMDQFDAKHALKGVVLDLRNNPGGLLEQAVDVASLFVDEGVIVSTKGRRDEHKEIKMAKKGMARRQVPLAILVNGASASASEIVAGALQDHKRAVVMGQPTFGKGSVQTVVEIAPEMGLKLTIARYYTPSGRSIQLKGIQPDVILDDLDQSVIDGAKRKQSLVYEKDLRGSMRAEEGPSEDIVRSDKSGDGGRSLGSRGDGGSSDENENFSTDELLAAENGTNSSSSDVSADAKTSAKPSEDVKPLVAKRDYQVRQAVNYLKSFQVLRAAGHQVVGPRSPAAETGDGGPTAIK